MERLTIKIVIHTVKALTDNYCYLVHREGSSQAVVIDPSESTPVLNALREHKLSCGLILNTHHHHDHIGGDRELSMQFECEIYCSQFDRHRIPGSTRGLKDNESFEFDKIRFETWSIPGHTKGQVAFYVAEARALFPGDTVFAMGCGRLFEGTPLEMMTSLKRLESAPIETRLYIGHEYTLRNAAFALSVEPSNRDIELRLQAILKAPSIREEQLVNPFLRLNSQEIRNSIGLTESNTTELDVFTRLRELRNTF